MPPSIPLRVLEHWEAAKGACVEPLQGGATANLRFRLTSAQGNSVLYCHHRERRERRLRLELRWRRLLSERGVPVVSVLPARDGDELVRCNDRWWSLNSWVEGAHYNYEDLEQCREAGLILARIHIPPDDLPLDPADGYTDGVDFWLSSPGAAAERLCRCLCRSGFGPKRARVWAATFEQWAHGIAGSLGSYSASCLTRTWTHGDFHGLNLRFQGHLVTGVLDFETSAVRPRVFELASAVVMLGRSGRGQYRLRPAWVEGLLTAYESICSPLEARERAALHPAMLLSQLPDLGFLESLQDKPVAVLAELERMRRALEELEVQAFEAAGA